MAKESTLTLTLKVDDQGTVVLDKFSKSIQKAGDDVSKMSKAMEVVSVSAFINIAQQAVNAANKIYDFGRAIASAGNDIQRQSRVFNMSTDDLQRWSYATKMADVDLEGFGQGFKFLTRSMGEALQGSGDALKAFNALGISLKDATGKTKDQQTVMLEVIGTLEKFADGVNRDALMLAIFGRGWMSFKPLVDQGTAAIKDNMAEAEKWNLILGRDSIKALSESEDAFKRWGETWRVVKMEVLTPGIVIIGNMIERIMALKRAWSEGGIKGVYKDIIAAQEEEGIRATPPAAWVKDWVAGYKPTLMRKPEAPGLPNQAGLNAAQKQLEDDAKAWGDFADQQIEALTKLNEVEIERRKEMLEDNDKILESYVKTAAEAMKFDDEAMKGAEAVQEEMDRYGTTLEIIRQRMEDSTLAMEEFRSEQLKVKDLESVWKSFGDELSSVWGNNVSNMIKGAQSFSDAVKNIFKGIGDAFISTVTKMITQWLLFGSITGKKEQGGGFLTGGSWGGIIGGISSIFSAFQEGGLVTRPMPALIGEAGPEAVIPLKGGKIPIEGGKGSSYQVINYIQVYDPQNYQRLYAPIIRKISEQSIADLKRYNKSSGRNM